MTPPDLAGTRRALHAVGELVLAGPQYRASATIKLRVSPGGFRTWAQPALAVVGTDVVKDGTGYAISGRTARDLAATLGVVAEAAPVYPASSGAAVDDVLQVDAVAAKHIADAYARGDAALRLFAPDVEPILWPEHFDVGIRADDVNFGVSPGDDYLAVPYAYVGVDPVPADDPFWNAPFGAALPMASFADVGSIRDFFAAGTSGSNSM